jgi:hypothetical protein
MTNDTRTIRHFASTRVATLGVPAVVSKSSMWEVKPFRSNSAVSKMLGLMLAHGEPLDLLNGQKIDVDKSLAWSNDKEYHHFFPQGYLARRAVPGSSSNVVGNIVLLTSKSNIEIRDRAPSDYLSEIVASSGRDQLVRRLESNLVPAEALDAALADNYPEFLRVRSKHLQAKAEQLAGQDVKETAEADEIEDSDLDLTD